MLWGVELGTFFNLLLTAPNILTRPFNIFESEIVLNWISNNIDDNINKKNNTNNDNNRWK